MTIICGIDPGKQGGWALLSLSGRLIRAGRLTLEDLPALYDNILHANEILIERAQGAFGQANQFEYGRGFGRVEAVALLTGADVYYCASSWWKGKLNIPADKKLAVAAAHRKFPNLHEYVKLASDDGVAEAALIGSILSDEDLFAQLKINNAKRTAPKKKRKSFRLPD